MAQLGNLIVKGVARFVSNVNIGGILTVNKINFGSGGSRGYLNGDGFTLKTPLVSTSSITANGGFIGALNGTAKNATNDADGRDIRTSYMKVYNTSWTGNSTAVTVNDLAAQNYACGMIYGTTDNPLGEKKWVHCISMNRFKGANTSWVSQLAIGASSSSLWYRSTSDATIVGKGWTRVLDSANYTSYVVAKTGGTFTGSVEVSGNLTFSNIATGMRGISGTVGVNVFWRIMGGATATNSGYCELATADDGNEPIYVRQYTGTFSTVTRTLTLLDGSGNTTIPGKLSTGGGLTVNGSITSGSINIGSGTLTSSLTTVSCLDGNKGVAIINSTAAGNGYNMLAKMNSNNGVWTIGSYQTRFELHYTANSVINAGTNAPTYTLKLLDESGTMSLPGNLRMPKNARITNETSLYIGNSANQGWVYMQDIRNQGSSELWSILATSGAATFASLDVTGTSKIQGTLTLSKTTGLSGTANNGPALIVGGTSTSSHIEIDVNEIQAKASGTTVASLYLNNDGGTVYANGREVSTMGYDKLTHSALSTNTASDTGGGTFTASTTISNWANYKFLVIMSPGGHRGNDLILPVINNVRSHAISDFGGNSSGNTGSWSYQIEATFYNGTLSIGITTNSWGFTFSIPANSIYGVK